MLPSAQGHHEEEAADRQGEHESLAGLNEKDSSRQKRGLVLTLLEKRGLLPSCLTVADDSQDWLNRERFLSGLVVVCAIAAIILMRLFCTDEADEAVGGHSPSPTGNVLRHIPRPGQDSYMALGILALPEPLRSPVIGFAEKLGVITYGRTPAEVAATLPLFMQVRLALLSRDLPLHGAGHLPALSSCPASQKSNSALGSSAVAANGDDDISVEVEYQTRHRLGGCASPKGMWATERVAPTVRYKYEVVAELFGLQQGLRVLDWGAGCGHALDIVAARRGFSAVALDLVEDNAGWGRKNMKHIGEFCGMDGSSLHFSDGSFDAVVSNGALVHVDGYKAQCRVVRDQVLRVLRPGGCAWFGFNGFVDTDASSEAPAPEFWARDGPCFAATRDVAVVTMQEQKLFGFSEYGRQDSYSLFVCKTRHGGASTIPWAVQTALGGHAPHGAGLAEAAVQQSAPEDWRTRSLVAGLEHDYSMEAAADNSAAALQEEAAQRQDAAAMAVLERSYGGLPARRMVSLPLDEPQ